MYKRILVATDGSTLSKRAERAAIDLAAALGAELVGLSVVPKLSRSLLSPTVAAASLGPGQVDSYWSDLAERTVQKLARAAQAARVPIRTVTVRSQSVAFAIVATAKKYGCEVIVMASHGRRGVGGVLLGSETQHVLVHASVPVLVVR